MPETPGVETVESPSISPNAALSSLTPAEREQWLRGDADIEEFMSKRAEATPAEKPEAPEAGTGTKESQEKKGVKLKTKEDTEKRAEELEKEGRTELANDVRLGAKVKRLEEELETLKKGAKPAESPSAQPKEVKLTAPEKPKTPKQTEFDSWEAFETARDKYMDEDLPKWSEEMADFKAKSAIQADREERATAEKNARIKAESDRITGQWQERIATERTTHSDFDAKTLNNADLKKVLLHDNGAPRNPTLDHFLMFAPYGAKLFYYLGDDLSEARRLVAMADVVELTEELSGLKSKLNGAPKKEEKTEPKETPARQVTRASKPPSEVGGSNSAPDDELEAALQRKDVRGYLREANKRDGIKR